MNYFELEKNHQEKLLNFFLINDGEFIKGNVHWTLHPYEFNKFTENTFPKIELLKILEEKRNFPLKGSIFIQTLENSIILNGYKDILIVWERNIS